MENKTQLTHFDVFFANRKKIRDIITFLIVLVIFSLILSLALNQSNAFFSAAFNLVFISLVGQQLEKGKNWAKVVLLILILTSMLQTIVAILFSLNPFNIITLLINIGFLGGFGYIVWYLGTSDSFSQYSELKQHGFNPEGEEPIALNEIIDTNRILPIKFREIHEFDAYLALTKKLMVHAKLEGSFESIRKEEEENKIILETEETLFEIPVNTKMRVMDKSFVNNINDVLVELKPSLQYVYIYPESILTIARDIHHLLLADDAELEKLIQYGYSKEE